MLLRDLLPVSRNRALAGETRRADPFYAMQRDMNRLFGEFWPEFELPAVPGGNGGVGAVAPRIDVSETEQAIQVTASFAQSTERELRGLLSAMARFRLRQGVILTWDEEDDLVVEGRAVAVRPLWRYLLEHEAS